MSARWRAAAGYWPLLCAAVFLAASATSSATSSAALSPADPDMLRSWSLDELVSRAAQRNPYVESQRSNALSSQYAVSAARWEYFPTPSVNVEGGRHGYLVTGALTQPLYSFGRIGADLRAAKSRASVAEAGIEEARYEIALRVMDAYGRLVAARSFREVYAEDIARLEALEGMMRRRVDTGLSASVDYNLVFTRLTLSQNNLTNYRAIEVSAVEALSQLVGVPIMAAQVEEPQGLAEQFFATTTDDLLSRAVAANPGLQRAEEQIDLARAEARAAERAAMPTIFARFEQRVADDEYYPSATPDTRVFLGVNYAFGAGLSTFDRAKSAQALVGAASSQRDAYLADLASQITADLENYRALRTLVGQLRESSEVQRQTFESYQRMFLAGKRSWLDLLNVTREQTEIERSLADAEVQFMIAAYRLKLLSGEFPWE
ncbi:TolC family protein [Aurantiacibacter flavus]|uniref:TolC family protein n=1 Tax=Aurantiacibacter flavus TaxID=3145232 RepID=A0ABV0D0V3_9SPHN